MSKTIEVKVPDIGDFGDVPVIELLVAVGDQVKEEDGLVTLESDKATMEVPSPAAGVISELKVALDDSVSEGDVVAVIEASDAGAGSEGSSAEEEKKPEAEQPLKKRKRQSPKQNRSPSPLPKPVQFRPKCEKPVLRPLTLRKCLMPALPSASSRASWVLTWDRSTVLVAKAELPVKT